MYHTITTNNHKNAARNRWLFRLRALEALLGYATRQGPRRKKRPPRCLRRSSPGCYRVSEETPLYPSPLTTDGIAKTKGPGQRTKVVESRFSEDATEEIK